MNAIKKYSFNKSLLLRQISAIAPKVTNSKNHKKKNKSYRKIR